MIYENLHYVDYYDFNPDTIPAHSGKFLTHQILLKRKYPQLD